MTTHSAPVTVCPVCGLDCRYHSALVVHVREVHRRNAKRAGKRQREKRKDWSEST